MDYKDILLKFKECTSTLTKEFYNLRYRDALKGVRGNKYLFIIEDSQEKYYDLGEDEDRPVVPIFSKYNDVYYIIDAPNTKSLIGFSLDLDEIISHKDLVDFKLMQGICEDFPNMMRNLKEMQNN